MPLSLCLLVAAGPGLLHHDDRIALIGDSITEQRMYSRIIETYLAACEPDLNVDFRQFGWSGETWDGLLGRVNQDVLRFHPTFAMSVYGMNDHGYRAFDQANGDHYFKNTVAAIDLFHGANCRFAVCSPNAIGKTPPWAPKGKVPEMNDNLTHLSRLAEQAAKEHNADFIDNNATMNVADKDGRAKYGPDYTIEGADGVHPGWAGHLVMAYALLKGLGLDGDLGTITVQLGKLPKATATGGHRILSFRKGVVTVQSSRYPFYIPVQPVNNNNTLASGASLVPFQQDLNRFRLVVQGAHGQVSVTWGKASKVFDADSLAQGINLPVEFPENPLTAAFKQVDDAVAAKQAFETLQIKTLFHGDMGRENMDWATAYSEPIRDQLAFAVKQRRVPVTYTIAIASAK